MERNRDSNLEVRVSDVEEILRRVEAASPQPRSQSNGAVQVAQVVEEDRPVDAHRLLHHGVSFVRGETAQHAVFHRLKHRIDDIYTTIKPFQVIDMQLTRGLTIMATTLWCSRYVGRAFSCACAVITRRKSAESVSSWCKIESSLKRSGVLLCTFASSNQ